MKTTLLSALLLLSTASALPARAEPPPATAEAVPPTPAPPTPDAPPPVPAPTLRRGPGGSSVVDEYGLTPEMVQKLSGEELSQVLLARAANRDGGKVAVLVPLGFFIFLLLSIAAGLYASFRKDRQRHETLRAMIEKGATIPPELLAPPVNPNADLRKGATLLGAGVGLTLFLAAVAEGGVWTLGLVPALIGLGFLISWRVTRAAPTVGAVQ